MKICTICSLEKPVEDFTAAKDNRRGKQYLRSSCKSCDRKAWNEADCAARNQRSEAARNRHLLRNYGISIVEYEVMLKEQAGVCAICKRPPVKMRLAVDHCHKTGKIRGLLCSRCNHKLLPSGRDNPVIFERAALYLKAIL